MPQTVNRYHIAQLLAVFATLTDEEREAIWRSLDPNREEAVREIIRKYVVPIFEAFTDESKARLKNALRYFLTAGAPWEDLFEMFMPPFQPPGDPRMFFLWLWIELTGEPFSPVNLQGFVVDNNIFDRSLTSR